MSSDDKIIGGNYDTSEDVSIPVDTDANHIYRNLEISKTTPQFQIPKDTMADQHIGCRWKPALVGVAVVVILLLVVGAGVGIGWYVNENRGRPTCTH